MNNLKIIGFVGGDAQVIDLKKADGSTVTTFSVATKEVRGSGETRKEYTTWHKITVFGDLQRFASTVDKADLVAVSGPLYTQSFAGKNGNVQTFSLRADIVEMLRRNSARTFTAPAQVAVPAPHSFDPDAPDAYPTNQLIDSPHFDEAEDRLDAVIPYEGPNSQFATMSPTPKARETIKALAAAKPKKTRTCKSVKRVAVIEAEVVPA